MLSWLVCLLCDFNSSAFCVWVMLELDQSRLWHGLPNIPGYVFSCRNEIFPVH